MNIDININKGMNIDINIDIDKHRERELESNHQVLNVLKSYFLRSRQMRVQTVVAMHSH